MLPCCRRSLTPGKCRVTFFPLSSSRVCDLSLPRSLVIRYPSLKLRLFALHARPVIFPSPFNFSSSHARLLHQHGTFQVPFKPPKSRLWPLLRMILLVFAGHLSVFNSFPSLFEWSVRSVRSLLPASGHVLSFPLITSASIWPRTPFL